MISLFLFHWLFFKVEEIEKTRLLAEEKTQEIQLKEDEAKQIEQDLLEAKSRVSRAHIHHLHRFIFHWQNDNNKIRFIFRFVSHNNNRTVPTNTKQSMNIKMQSMMTIVMTMMMTINRHVLMIELLN